VSTERAWPDAVGAAGPRECKDLRGSALERSARSLGARRLEIAAVIRVN